MALEVAGRGTPPRTGALDGRVVAPFQRGIHADRLAGAPLRRAVRSALAPQSRDLRNLLAAAELAAADLAAEVDELGQALGQVEIVAGAGMAPGGRA
jgi:hypothetical protein